MPVAEKASKNSLHLASRDTNDMTSQKVIFIEPSAASVEKNNQVKGVQTQHVDSLCSRPAVLHSSDVASSTEVNDLIHFLNT